VYKSMSAEEYIAHRVDQFREWYDGKAVYAKNRYLRIRVIAVAGAVLVPVVANAIPEHPDLTRYSTTILSLIVSLAVALDSVFHFGDQWKNYRSTEQFLSREKFLFSTGDGPYKEMDPAKAFMLLVERCEAQISAENSATLNVIVPTGQKQDTPAAKGG
jgi:hypothetical protein